MIKKLTQGAFWGAVGIILYTYIGFPLLLMLRGFWRPRPVQGDSTATPVVSIIVAAYNEVEVIAKKLDNLLSINYPQTHLDIIIASDGSDDGTNSIVANYNADNVRLLALPRQGKNNVINKAVDTARGEILVFTDADSTLTSEALRYLVAPFADSTVGGVAGDYRHINENVPDGKGERAYWNYDRVIKQLQSQGGSLSAASGAIYAIRRSLFTPVPDGVTDDFFVAMQIARMHYRLVFEPQAVAYGPIAPSSQAEFRRKVRIMTRGFYGLWLMRQLLNPFEYGFFSLQLFSHKVLRRLMVIPLLLLAITSPLLWSVSLLYKLATIVQVSFHGAALVGYGLQKTHWGRLKILSLPFHFDLIYAAAAVALVNFAQGKRYKTWIPERSTIDEMAVKAEGFQPES